MNGILEKLPFWEALTESEKRTVSASGVLRRFAAGTELCSGGSAGGLGMVLVVSGEVRALIPCGEGRNVTLFCCGEGESCFFAAPCAEMGASLTAVLDSVLLMIPACVFSTLRERSLHVRCFSAEFENAALTSALWIMRHIQHSGTDRVLASFFFDEYRKTDKTDIRMTHEQIAGLVNTPREDVSRAVGQLALDGIIESRGGTIVLRDIEALKTLAGTSPANRVKIKPKRTVLTQLS